MTRIKLNTDRENKWIILGIWMLICAGGKYIQLKFLPAKYSYDGRRILLEAFTGDRSGDKGYDTAADVFVALNKIFHINSYENWAVLFGIAGSIIILFFIHNSLKQLYLTDFIFLSCTLFLMNVYLFNVSKEIIQIVMLIPAIYILQSRYKNSIKVAVVLCSLLCIAFFLRTYFLLTAGIFVLIYGLYSYSLNHKGRKNWKNIIRIFIIGFIGLLILQSFLPDLYERLIYIRNYVNAGRINSQDAKTMIVDLLDNNGSILIYILNTGINIFRLMFPISLLNEGIAQILFLIYQIILSVKLILAFYRQTVQTQKGVQDKNAFIAVSLIIAYFVVAAIFEPDYGSAVRHEMALFPIMYIALFAKDRERRLYESDR